MRDEGREELLGAVRAASEEGARKALEMFNQEKGSCALFTEHGSIEANTHVSHHEAIGRYFVPLINKVEGTAISIVSWGFWVVLVMGVIVAILLAADIKPFSLLKIHISETGGK